MDRPDIAGIECRHVAAMTGAAEDRGRAQWDLLAYDIPALLDYVQALEAAILTAHDQLCEGTVNDIEPTLAALHSIRNVIFGTAATTSATTPE